MFSSSGQHSQLHVLCSSPGPLPVSSPAVLRAQQGLLWGMENSTCSTRCLQLSPLSDRFFPTLRRGGGVIFWCCFFSNSEYYFGKYLGIDEYRIAASGSNLENLHALPGAGHRLGHRVALKSRSDNKPISPGASSCPKQRGASCGADTAGLTPPRDTAACSGSAENGNGAAGTA